MTLAFEISLCLNAFLIIIAVVQYLDNRSTSIAFRSLEKTLIDMQKLNLELLSEVSSLLMQKDVKPNP